MHREPMVRARMEYDDERSAVGFHTLFTMDLANKDVLDLGCGYGGRSVYFKELGARRVVAMEIRGEMIDEALAFAAERGVTLEGLVSVGEQIGLPHETIDIITCYDVFEHVESVAATLQECYRVLRPGGIAYIVFPPYLHPLGGSHLHSYLSRSPAPNALFGRDTLWTAVRELLIERGTFVPDKRPTDPLPGVNGTTIAQFRKALAAVPFRDAQVTLRPVNVPRLGAVASALSRIPVVQEVAVSRLLCELAK
ncbi:MAG: class I SAM-dependent methyltransferase [Gemmatimonadota bacterium]